MMRGESPFALFVASSLYALLAVFASAPASAQSAEPWPTKGWVASTPEEQGMDSAELANLVGFGGKHGFDSLLVVRHGRIAAEAYYAPYAPDIPHNIHSGAKAVVGSLIGMLYKDGVLDRLDHPVLDFFADRNVANVDDDKRAITIQNLLDMTSGLDWDEGFEDGKNTSLAGLGRSHDWVGYVLDRPMAHKPGETFYYNSGGPHLLSAIINKLTGESAEDFARKRLFGPLGIATWRWERDPQGVSRGASDLSLLPRDMAKIGYLYLRHGEWEGRQLLPSSWTDILHHATVNMNATYDPDQRYSDLFWVFPGGHVYMMVGWHGQLIAVFPELDVVAAVTAHRRVSFFALIKGVAGAVKSETALPPNTASSEKLAEAVRLAAAAKPALVAPEPEEAAAVSGKLYKLAENGLGLNELTLYLADPNPRVEYVAAQGDPAQTTASIVLPIGLHGHYGQRSSRAGAIHVARSMWISGTTLSIEDLDIGSGSGERKYLLTFDGRKLNLRLKNDEGHEISIDGEQSD